MTSAEIRDELARRIGLDLVGPPPGHAFAHELLPDPPNQWYLCGFLIPSDAAADEREDPEAADELDGAEPDDSRAQDDATARDAAAAARRSFFPSSMGISVLIPSGVSELEAEVTWGDYLREAREVEEVGQQPATAIASREPEAETAASPELQVTQRCLHRPMQRAQVSAVIRATSAS